MTLFRPLEMVAEGSLVLSRWLGRKKHVYFRVVLTTADFVQAVGKEGLSQNNSKTKNHADHPLV